MPMPAGSWSIRRPERPASPANTIAGQAYREDENAVGSDTGNMAWAALALVQAHALLPKRAGDPYLNAALSLTRWIVASTRVDDARGGFSAGMQGFERQAGVSEGQDRRNYRSTEHNIDLAALFEHLAATVRMRYR
jgi:hypothetical protein